MDLKQNRIRSGSQTMNLIRNLTNIWSTNGKLRTTAFLYKLAEKQLIKLNGRRITNGDLERFGIQIDSMITVLNRVYGNNWDFHLDPAMSSDNKKLLFFYLDVKILFPNITITNTAGDLHNIKDLIVTFGLKKSDNYDQFSLCPFELKGTRGFMTFQEWFIGYNHSHLRSSKPKSFDEVFISKDFCTGGDTEIVHTMTELNISGYSEEQFELFLYLIETMVQWESTEGVPYMHIKNIIPVTETTYIANLNPDSGYLSSGFKQLFKYNNEIKFNYVFNGNRFRIKNDDVFNSYIKQCIIENDEGHGFIRNFIIKEVNGINYGYSITSDDSGISTKRLIRSFESESVPYTLFQGNKVEFKVTEFSGETPDINKYKVNPKFIEYVAEQLEQVIYYKTVRRSTVDR